MTDNAELLPCGWRLVPVEPTPEMTDAGAEMCEDAYSGRAANAVWSAMVSAAPAPIVDRGLNTSSVDDNETGFRDTQAPVTTSPPVVGKEPICLPPDDTDVKLVLHATLPTCPCCSGTPTTFARYFEHSAIYQSYVHCSHCDVQVFVNSRDREEARKHAIARWSKRPAALSKPRVSREEQQAAFLVALAEAGIPPDVQELLVQGNPSIGVPPGALGKAIALIGGGA